MPYFLIEDFRSGLDSRRMSVLSVPGSLLKLVNAHVNRGGEIEKRLAFVQQMVFPAATYGLLAVGSALYTFGSDAAVALPADAPSNLTYQQLAAPNNARMVSVLRATSFKGKPYVIAQYEDGGIHHFYGGTLHAEFVEARARTDFRITGGTAGGVSATASFRINGGLNTSEDQVTLIRVGTFPILTAMVQHNGNNAATAAAVAAAINAFVGPEDFTAIAAGNVVTVTATRPGTWPNGLPLMAQTVGGFVIDQTTAMGGGVDNAIATLRVDGVNILGDPVLHTGDNVQTAALVAAAINDYQSTPEYRATSVGDRVNVVIQQAGASNNGRTLAMTVTGDVVLNPAASELFTDGQNLVTSPAGSETYLPGEFAKPALSKMYTTAGPLLHFSEIDDPLDVNNTNNAGFIDLSTTGEGSDRLVAIANYNNNLAVFSDRTVQIWFVDVDPANNQLVQVLNNTGAIASGSVQEIGDSDVLYLSESGIRSLRARNSSNAAFASDVGNPIDTLILDKLTNKRLDAIAAKAVLEPRDGRYMLAIGPEIFVFSFFPASKVSAWSTYEPGFTVTDWAIVGRRLYCRGDDGKLYLLGGRTGDVYDRCHVEAVLPFTSAATPATIKGWQGMDVALEGVWQVSMASDHNEPNTYQVIGNVEESTMNKGHMAFQARSTHISLKATHDDDGPAKLGSLMLHYEGGSQG